MLMLTQHSVAVKVVVNVIVFTVVMVNADVTKDTAKEPTITDEIVVVINFYNKFNPFTQAYVNTILR